MKSLPYLLTLIVALAGCNSLVAPQRSVTHHVLTDPGPIVPSQRTHPASLLLREMDVPAFYQVPRLVYSSEPGTRMHYQYAHWSELPARRLIWLLRQRMEAAGTFAVVAGLGGGVQGDYQLNTRLIDFYHDASQPPGIALLILEAELVRRASAELVERRIFVAQAPVARYDAEAATEALGRAANQVIDEVIVWLERAVPAAR